MSEMIRVIGTSGREGKGEGQFAQPRGVCINSATKELFVVDCNNHRIQVFHLLSLSFIRQVGKGQQGSSPGLLTYPVGICLDEKNNSLFVADTNNHRIVVFNHITGVYIRSIGSQGSELGSLNCPYGVFVDAEDSHLYVADYENNRIQVFDCETGNFLRLYGQGQGTAPGQFNQPIDVCLDSDFGHVIIADYSNNRVQILDKMSGTFIRSVGETGGSDALNGPRALCLNKSSNLLFVSDRENHRVQIYNRTNYMLLRSIGQGVGLNPGQFNRPMELCVDNDEGVLIVVDGYNHRVQIFDLPELQAEKNRLRELKEKKSIQTVNKSIRPSLTAITLPVPLNEFKLIEYTHDNNNNNQYSYGLLESFQSGFPYVLVLSHQEIQLLAKYFPDFSLTNNNNSSSSKQISFDFVEEGGSERKGMEFLKSANQSLDSFVHQQANIFLTILEKLPDVSANNYEIILLMATPSVLGLHSLLMRGWIPNHLQSPLSICKILLHILFHIQKAAVNESEMMKLFVTSLELLKLIILQYYSTFYHELLSLIFSLFHSSLSPSTGNDSNQSVTTFSLLEFFGLSNKLFQKSLENNSLRNNDQAHSSGFSLYAFFELLSFFLQIWNLSSNDKLQLFDSFYQFIRESYLNAKDQNQQINSMKFDLRIKLETRLKDIFSLIFAIQSDKFMEKLSKLSASSSSSSNLAANTSSSSSNLSFMDSSYIFRFPHSFITMIEKLFQLLLKQDLFVGINNQLDENPSQKLPEKLNEEDLTRARMELFHSFTNYFKEIHGWNHSSEPKITKRTRGGRTIWDGQAPIAPGDLLDCMDKERSWFESLVLEVSSDGTLKIHFMGWGSKWDDIITTNEMATRIAPLNTYTRDWRNELFEGGLIEIKCNDDLVNQKWMWGRISKLNREENWLEVAYSFSNEPVVVKKAWLYGETICPVGMHTKDKSKAAAANISKPEKSVTEIMKEKSLQDIPPSEYCIFDVEDDFIEEIHGNSSNASHLVDRNESFSSINRPIFTKINSFGSMEEDENITQLPADNGSSSNFQSQNSSAKSFRFLKLTAASSFPSSSSISSAYSSSSSAASSSSPAARNRIVAEFAEILFARLSREILITINELTFLSPEELMNPQHPQLLTLKELFQSLTANENIINQKYLLYSYLIKPLYYQAGGRAKLLATPALLRDETTRDFLINEFTKLSDLLMILQQQYSFIVTTIFYPNILSNVTIYYILEKLKLTILYCGFTTLANDIISSFIHSPSLFYESFQPLMIMKSKFSNGLIPVRKLFRSILSAASSEQVEKFLIFLENSILKEQLLTSFSLSFLKKNMIKDSPDNHEDDQDHEDLSRMMSLANAMQFLDKFYENLTNCQNIIQFEIFSSNRLIFANERILFKESLSFHSLQQMNYLIHFLCQGLFLPSLLPFSATSSSALSSSGYSLNAYSQPLISNSLIVSNYIPEMIDYGTAVNYLEKAGKLLSLIQNEQFSYHFYEIFLQFYWFPLFCKHEITAFPVDILKSILRNIPYGMKLQKELNDFEFSKLISHGYLLSMIEQIDHTRLPSVSSGSSLLNGLDDFSSSFPIPRKGQPQQSQHLHHQQHSAAKIPPFPSISKPTPASSTTATTTVASEENDLHTFYLQGGQFTVSIMNATLKNSPSSSSSSSFSLKKEGSFLKENLFASMKLPKSLEIHCQSFEKYYFRAIPFTKQSELANAAADGPEKHKNHKDSRNSQRLFWYPGLGQMVVHCILNNKRTFEIIVNEVQFSLLHLFEHLQFSAPKKEDRQVYLNQRATSFSIGELSEKLNLSIQLSYLVVQSLAKECCFPSNSSSTLSAGGSPSSSSSSSHNEERSFIPLLQLKRKQFKHTTEHHESSLTDQFLTRLLSGEEEVLHEICREEYQFNDKEIMNYLSVLVSQHPAANPSTNLYMSPNRNLDRLGSMNQTNSVSNPIICWNYQENMNMILLRRKMILSRISSIVSDREWRTQKLNSTILRILKTQSTMMTTQTNDDDRRDIIEQGIFKGLQRSNSSTSSYPLHHQQQQQQHEFSLDYQTLKEKCWQSLKLNDKSVQFNEKEFLETLVLLVQKGFIYQNRPGIIDKDTFFSYFPDENDISSLDSTTLMSSMNKEVHQKSMMGTISSYTSQYLNSLAHQASEKSGEVNAVAPCNLRTFRDKEFLLKYFQTLPILKDETKKIPLSQFEELVILFESALLTSVPAFEELLLASGNHLSSAFFEHFSIHYFTLVLQQMNLVLTFHQNPSDRHAEDRLFHEIAVPCLDVIYSILNYLLTHPSAVLSSKLRWNSFQYFFSENQQIQIISLFRQLLREEEDRIIFSSVSSNSLALELWDREFFLQSLDQIELLGIENDSNKVSMTMNAQLIQGFVKYLLNYFLEKYQFLTEYVNSAVKEELEAKMNFVDYPNESTMSPTSSTINNDENNQILQFQLSLSQFYRLFFDYLTLDIETLDFLSSKNVLMKPPPPIPSTSLLFPEESALLSLGTSGKKSNSSSPSRSSSLFRAAAAVSQDYLTREDMLYRTAISSAHNSPVKNKNEIEQAILKPPPPPLPRFLTSASWRKESGEIPSTNPPHLYHAIHRRIDNDSDNFLSEIQEKVKDYKLQLHSHYNPRPSNPQGSSAIELLQSFIEEDGSLLFQNNNITTHDEMRVDENQEEVDDFVAGSNEAKESHPLEIVKESSTSTVTNMSAVPSVSSPLRQFSHSNSQVDGASQEEEEENRNLPNYLANLPPFCVHKLIKKIQEKFQEFFPSEEEKKESISSNERIYLGKCVDLLAEEIFSIDSKLLSFWWMAEETKEERNSFEKVMEGGFQYLHNQFLSVSNKSIDLSKKNDLVSSKRTFDGLLRGITNKESKTCNTECIKSNFQLLISKTIEITGLPWYQCCLLLSQHRFDFPEFLDSFYHSSHQSTQSFSFYFGNELVVSDREWVCYHCQHWKAPSQMSSLNCNHFACEDCWKLFILNSLKEKVSQQREMKVDKFQWIHELKCIRCEADALCYCDKRIPIDFILTLFKQGNEEKSTERDLVKELEKEFLFEIYQEFFEIEEKKSSAFNLSKYLNLGTSEQSTVPASKDSSSKSTEKSCKSFYCLICSDVQDNQAPFCLFSSTEMDKASSSPRSPAHSHGNNSKPTGNNNYGHHYSPPTSPPNRNSKLTFMGSSPTNAAAASSRKSPYPSTSPSNQQQPHRHHHHHQHKGGKSTTTSSFHQSNESKLNEIKHKLLATDLSLNYSETSFQFSFLTKQYQFYSLLCNAYYLVDHIEEEENYQTSTDIFASLLFYPKLFDWRFYLDNSLQDILMNFEMQLQELFVYYQSLAPPTATTTTTATSTAPTNNKSAVIEASTFHELVVDDSFSSHNHSQNVQDGFFLEFLPELQFQQQFLAKFQFLIENLRNIHFKLFSIFSFHLSIRLMKVTNSSTLKGKKYERSQKNSNYSVSSPYHSSYSLGGKSTTMNSSFLPHLPRSSSSAASILNRAGGFQNRFLEILRQRQYGQQQHQQHPNKSSTSGNSQQQAMKNQNQLKLSEELNQLFQEHFQNYEILISMGILANPFVNYPLPLSSNDQSSDFHEFLKQFESFRVNSQKLLHLSKDYSAELGQSSNSLSTTKGAETSASVSFDPLLLNSQSSSLLKSFQQHFQLFQMVFESFDAFFTNSVKSKNRLLEDSQLAGHGHYLVYVEKMMQLLQQEMHWMNMKEILVQEVTFVDLSSTQLPQLKRRKGKSSKSMPNDWGEGKGDNYSDFDDNRAVGDDDDEDDADDDDPNDEGQGSRRESSRLQSFEQYLSLLNSLLSFAEKFLPANVLDAHPEQSDGSNTTLLSSLLFSSKFQFISSCTHFIDQFQEWKGLIETKEFGEELLLSTSSNFLISSSSGKNSATNKPSNINGNEFSFQLFQSHRKIILLLKQFFQLLSSSSTQFLLKSSADLSGIVEFTINYIFDHPIYPPSPAVSVSQTVVGASNQTITPSQVNEVNQKKDALLMELFEFLWKEVSFLQIHTHQNISSLHHNYPFSQIFLMGFHKIIQIIRRNNFEKKVSQKTNNHSSSNEIHPHNQNQVNKDDSNYFLLISLIQRILSNYHDVYLYLVLLLLDAHSTSTQDQHQKMSINHQDEREKEDTATGYHHDHHHSLELLSEICLELFTNHYFVFILRTIMNSPFPSNEIPLLQSWISRHFTHTSSAFHFSMFTQSPASNPIFRYHQMISAGFLSFFEKSTTFQSFSSLEEFLDHHPNLRPQQQQQQQQQSAQRLLFQKRTPSTDTEVIVIVKPMPSDFSASSNNSSSSFSPGGESKRNAAGLGSSRSLSLYSSSTLMKKCKEMLLSFNLLYSFWMFYFEYYYQFGETTAMDRRPLATTTSMNVDERESFVFQFYTLLIEKKNSLFSCYLDVFPLISDTSSPSSSTSSVYYLKSFYQNSLLVLQNLLELFHEKCSALTITSSPHHLVGDRNPPTSRNPLPVPREEENIMNLELFSQSFFRSHHSSPGKTDDRNFRMLGSGGEVTERSVFEKMREMIDRDDDEIDGLEGPHRNHATATAADDDDDEDDEDEDSEQLLSQQPRFYYYYDENTQQARVHGHGWPLTDGHDEDDEDDEGGEEVSGDEDDDDDDDEEQEEEDDEDDEGDEDDDEEEEEDVDPEDDELPWEEEEFVEDEDH